MNETSKANKLRPDRQIYIRYPVLDIGGALDPYPKSQITDIKFGQDANNILQYYAIETYNTVYSSHCLEHLNDPLQVIKDWYKLVKPGGTLVLLLPDFDLYEHGEWPSRFGEGHKWAFSTRRPSSEFLINVYDLDPDPATTPPPVRIITCDTNYNYQLPPGVDQTLTSNVEANIEVVWEK